MPWWAGIAASAVTSALLAGCFALATRRARGHAYIMVTFAALELLKVLAMNLTAITNGNHGLVMPFLRVDREYQLWPYYFGTLALLVLTVALVIMIRRSKFGAGLLSIREDEDKAASVGIPTSRYKLIALVLSGVPVGLAGGIYAYYIGFVEPRGMFLIAVSMQIVLAVLLGGRGTIVGPLLGAAIVEPLSQLTNSLVGGCRRRRMEARDLRRHPSRRHPAPAAGNHPHDRWPGRETSSAHRRRTDRAALRRRRDASDR